MAKFISMKMTKKESKEMSSPAEAKKDTPRYPYGLEIYLKEESLDKLGMSEMPNVGDTMQIMAKVKVTGVRESESVYGKDKSLDLQITDLALGDDE